MSSSPIRASSPKSNEDLAPFQEGSGGAPSSFLQDSIAYCRSLFARFWAAPEEEPWEVVEESTQIYSIASEDARRLSSLVPLAAAAAECSYEMPSVVRAVEICDCPFEACFLSRKSGLDVQGTPALFLKSEEGKVVIAIPGTVDANDWLSNLTSEIVPFLHTLFIKDSDDVTLFFKNEIAVHRGFLPIALSIVDDLKKEFSDDSLQSLQEIIFTGHSQGAAVAQLLALYTSTHKKHLNIKQEISISCISFGSPRVFSKDSYKFICEQLPLLVNISHPADIVQRLPLGAQGFKHAGMKIKFSLSNIQDVFTQETSEDLTKSIHGDLKAASHLASRAYKTLNPLSWHESIICAHSMKSYSEMCSCVNSLEYIFKMLVGRQIELKEEVEEVDLTEERLKYRALFKRGAVEELDQIDLEEIKESSS